MEKIAMTKFINTIKDSSYDLDTDLNNISKDIVGKKKKYSIDFENSNINVYVTPTGYATASQRKANKSAKIAIIKEDGLGDALNVQYWVRHPKVQNADADSFVLMMGGIVETTITLMLATNGFKARHKKGQNFTKEFNAVSTDFGFEIEDRKIVGDSPRLQELISKFTEELLRIKNFPISDTDIPSSSSTTKEKIKFVCEEKCEENKTRKFSVNLGDVIKLVSPQICGECEQEILPTDSSVVVFTYSDRDQTQVVDRILEEVGLTN